MVWTWSKQISSYLYIIWEDIAYDLYGAHDLDISVLIWRDRLCYGEIGYDRSRHIGYDLDIHDLCISILNMTGLLWSGHDISRLVLI